MNQHFAAARFKDSVGESVLVPIADGPLQSGLHKMVGCLLTSSACANSSLVGGTVFMSAASRYQECEHVSTVPPENCGK